jgi:hypothetical protein
VQEFFPNENYRTVFKFGMTGWDVWTIQIAMNSHSPSPNLVEDGIFGKLTEAAVKEVQAALHITVDGICGAETQADFCGVKCDHTHGLVPKGLIKGVCFGESSGIIPTTSSLYVNNSRDYGPLQDNKISPTQNQIKEAYNPEAEAWKTAGIIAGNHAHFKEFNKTLVRPLTEEELWKDALFAYNWPAAATAIAERRGESFEYQESGTNNWRKLSDATPWIEAYKVVWDGQPVKTGWDWYKFYVGSKSTYVTTWAVT